MEDTQKKDKVKGLKDKFLDKMKTNKKFELAVYGILIAVAIIVYVSTLNDSARSEDVQAELSAAQTLSEETVEARLERALSSIRGAGDVKVMITYETGSQLVTAMSENTQQSSSNSDGSSQSTQSESKQPATVNKDGGNEPIVLTEVQPLIRGVIVIAEGASDISVRVNLQKAVATVLGVDNSCIEVFEMDYTDNN